MAGTFKGWHQFVNWVGTKRTMIWFYKRVGRPVDSRLLHWSKGRYSLMFGKSVGILNTIGAKTGLKRHTSLLYMEDDQRIILVASNFGSEHHPAWYRNLVKNPDVSFIYRGKVETFHARTADETERETLWPRCLAYYAGFAAYQARVSERQIPIVVLEPQSKS